MTAAEPESGRPWRDPGTLDRLEPMLRLLEASHVSLSSVTDPERARSVHVADSLSGLACEEVGTARRAVDLGAGAGFPGIPLATVLPECDFTLLESVGRKVEFMNEAIAALGIDNARAVKGRSEDWAAGEGREAYDLVVARAVAPLPELAELASPLLAEGGHLVAWKGEREAGAEAVIEEHGDELAMRLEREQTVVPFPGSRERRLYVLVKAGPTPKRLPRRAGMARKRPIGGRSGPSSR